MCYDGLRDAAYRELLRLMSLRRRYIRWAEKYRVVRGSSSSPHLSHVGFGALDACCRFLLAIWFCSRSTIASSAEAYSCCYQGGWFIALDKR